MLDTTRGDRRCELYPRCLDGHTLAPPDASEIESLADRSRNLNVHDHIVVDPINLERRDSSTIDSNWNVLLARVGATVGSNLAIVVGTVISIQL
ncbi:hypothetical protein [Natronolimnobius baerhuensis]|uniref:hypothetical protein n=1 Tax=Natronolimnobius baerhuensis TaxID=253108 RepID=UPI0011250BC6|nr:hypothetical protein [Natronolimnobius baerhuensis]